MEQGGFETLIPVDDNYPVSLNARGDNTPIEIFPLSRTGRDWAYARPHRVVVIASSATAIPIQTSQESRLVGQWPGVVDGADQLRSVVMSDSWDERVDLFWASADEERAEAMLKEMRILLKERGDLTPDALYEWASVHDFLGREAEAIPLYRSALDRGLVGERRSQAIVQLASSLRNVGDPESAVAVLHGHPSDAVTGAAPQAFLALALRDAGRSDEALRVALRALAPTLPLYSRAIEDYADNLVARSTEH